MTQGVAAQDTRLARMIAILLLIATGIRSLASITAGFVEWHHSGPPGFEPGRVRAGDVLTSFGATGDVVSILLLVVAATAVWWCLRSGDSTAPTLRLFVNGAFGVVAVLAVMNAVGVAFFDSVVGQTSRTIVETGEALACVVVAVGSIVLLRQYDAAINALAFEEEDPGIDAFVFAVDRKSGDVRAFLSARRAVRGLHIYWVEDDEFVFYTDEGVVLDASVVDERIVFHLTETVRLDDLLSRLREFVTRRGIRVDAANADDPAAYAVPIARWQGLEMWPPWLRPLGLLFQPRG
jgi:hypothetical protein